MKFDQSDIRVYIQRSTTGMFDGKEAITAEIVWMDVNKDRMNMLVLSNEQLLISLQEIDAIADYNGTCWVKVPMPSIITDIQQYDWMHLDTFLHRNMPENGKTEEDKRLALNLVLNYVNNRAEKPQA